MTNGNGWDEYKRLVMSSIDRLSDEIRHERESFKDSMAGVYERLIETEKQVAMLTVRCGITGLLGGLIPAVAALILSKT